MQQRWHVTGERLITLTTYDHWGLVETHGCCTERLAVLLTTLAPVTKYHVTRLQQNQSARLSVLLIITCITSVLKHIIYIATSVMFTTQLLWTTLK